MQVRARIVFVSAKLTYIIGNMSDNPRKIIIESITRMLSRREHAFNELLRKLAQKGFDERDSLPIAEEFRQAGIQSDARYAEMKVRSGIAKGQGPARIKADCQQWRIDEGLMEQAFWECEADWYALAQSVRIKRFGVQLPPNEKEKFKQSRFLQYRGFYSDHIQHAFSLEE